MPRFVGKRSRVVAFMLAPVIVLSTVGLLAAAWSPAEAAGPPSPDPHHMDHMADHHIDPKDQAAAMLATAAYQDVSSAEAAGYGSTLHTLGCFQNATQGGM